MISFKKLLLSFYRALSGKGLSFLFPKKFLLWVQRTLTNKFQTEEKVVVFDIGKFKYHFFPTSNDKLLLRGIYERGVTEIIKKVSKNFDIFVDVGACYGYFTLISDSERKIAIEPDPINFEVLSTNIRENKINVDLINKAISDKSGYSTLYISEKRRCHSLKEEHIFAEIKEKIKVETTTIDRLLQSTENKSILFKVDVEGHEPYVFQGMPNLVKNERIAIIFEYNPHKYNQEEKQIVVNFASNFSTYLIDDEKGSLEFLGNKSLEKIEKQHNILLSNEVIQG